MTRNEEVTSTIEDLGAPAFWGFVDEDECCVHMNFSPCGAKAGVNGPEYSIAYYTAEQVRALLRSAERQASSDQ